MQYVHIMVLRLSSIRRYPRRYLDEISSIFLVEFRVCFVFSNLLRNVFMIASNVYASSLHVWSVCSIQQCWRASARAGAVLCFQKRSPSWNHPSRCFHPRPLPESRFSYHRNPGDVPCGAHARAADGSHLWEPAEVGAELLLRVHVRRAELITGGGWCMYANFNEFCEFQWNSSIFASILM